MQFYAPNIVCFSRCTTYLQAMVTIEYKSWLLNIFTIFIILKDTSKKLAKRAAAYAMVEQLEKMDIDCLTAKQAGGPDVDGPTHDVTQVKLIEK